MRDDEDAFRALMAGTQVNHIPVPGTRRVRWLRVPMPDRVNIPDDGPACSFTLPISPSTNNLYEGRRWKSAAYANWQTSAGWAVKAQRPVPLKGRLRVLIEAPFARNRDLDNIKPVLDLAQSLGIIENDNRVDRIEIVRTAPGTEMRVSIWPM